MLAGEVTFAKEARTFQRNGQLRFLFETVHAPGQESMALPAALFSVDASKDDNIAVDEEGGTKTTNSKTRFIAPTLGLLALRGAIGGDGHRFADRMATAAFTRPAPGSGAAASAGFSASA